jgi:spore maturation protein B
MEKITAAAVPALLLVCALLLLLSKKDLFSSFISGAESGLETTVKLLPGLVLMCTAASLFTASGAADVLTSILSPITSRVGIPAEIVPFLTVRPISGAASNSVLTELYKTSGADSLAGFTASVIAGSSDTMFYIFAVYFSAAGVKRTRYAVVSGVVTMLAVILFGCFIARLFY